MLIAAFISLNAGLEGGVSIPVSVKDYSSRPVLVHTVGIVMDGRSLYADISALTDADDCAMIYRGEMKTLFIVDRSKRVVAAYDGNVVDGLSSGIGFARATAQRIVDKLRGGVTKPRQPSIQLRRTELKRYIQGRQCRAFFIMQDGRKLQEIWATSWELAGVDSQDLRPLRELLSYMSQVLSEPSFSKLAERLEYIPAKELLQLDGFPALIRHFNESGLAYDISIGKARRIDVDQSRFRLPDGYARRNGFAQLLNSSF